MMIVVSGTAPFVTRPVWPSEAAEWLQRYPHATLREWNGLRDGTLIEAFPPLDALAQQIARKKNAQESQEFCPESGHGRQSVISSPLNARKPDRQVGLSVLAPRLTPRVLEQRTRNSAMRDIANRFSEIKTEVLLTNKLGIDRQGAEFTIADLGGPEQAREAVIKAVANGMVVARVPCTAEHVRRIEKDGEDVLNVIPVAWFHRVNTAEIAPWLEKHPTAVLQWRTFRRASHTDINLATALAYANEGIAVLVCGPDKKPKPGVMWQSQSTTNEKTIRAWFKSWPDSIVGIDLAKSGLIVIDCDRHDNGHDGVAAFAELQTDDVRHPIVRTRSSGEHHYFLNPDKLGNGRGNLPKGIDVRGAGGYVIAGGSITEHGSWVADEDAPGLLESFRDGTLAVLPERLAAIILALKPDRDETAAPGSAEGQQETPPTGDTRGRAYAEAALARCYNELAPLSDDRNQRLNPVAFHLGRMVGRGWLSAAEIESRLMEACQANGKLAKDGAKQCLATIRSGLSKGRLKPHENLKTRERVDEWGEVHEEAYAENDADSSIPQIQSSAQFVKGFVPPDYLIDGVSQRRFIYSNTGKPGAGKTAVTHRFSAHIGLGLDIGKYEVQQGRVLFLAGENPDDHRMRWIVLADEMSFDIESIPVYFIPGVFKISKMAEHVAKEIEKIGGVVLVVVDTSAAYFEGDNENDNVQQGNHARLLREHLTKLPGGPTVIVNSHPTKNASDENLVPRGGGAALAEFDGNYTCKKIDGLVEFHTQAKFRGAEFAPIMFKLRTVTSEALKDSKGRLIPSVIAEPIDDEHQEAIESDKLDDENMLLAALASHSEFSLVQFAERLGWKMRDGSPHKMKVSRLFENLSKAKLVKKERGGKYVITKKGQTQLESDVTILRTFARKSRPS
jgi:hypothetical protein